MDFIPTDIIFDIFLRLPEKSIARCCCVSKLWASMLHLPDFTELFLTKSLARPRLLFAVKDGGGCRFFSLLQPQQPCENSSSLVVAADFHMNFPRGNMWTRGSSSHKFSCGYASGLIYFPDTWISIEGDDTVPVICNPNTGQYAILPEHKRYRNPYIRYPLNRKESSSFLGFDPIDKQYKVLFIDYPYFSKGCDYRIHTLGSVKMMWRNIKCPLIHEPLSEGVCIDGVLYYLANCGTGLGNVIVCFDVRSEEFTFTNAEYFSGWRTQIVNYKGKLCVICLRYDGINIVHEDIALRMWVLQDVEKHEWSKHDYTFSNDKLVYHLLDTFVVGVTAMGEIVFSMKCRASPFYVFYFNPENNTCQSVKIRGFVGWNDDMSNTNVYTFVNHVADLNVNYANALFKTSISAPSVKNENGLNIIINKGPKPQRQEKLRKGTWKGR